MASAGRLFELLLRRPIEENDVATWRWWSIAMASAMLAGLQPAVVFAADPQPPAALLHGLQTWLDGTRDLECRFEQTLVSGAFGAGIRELGHLYLKRPGKMRWEYTRPDPKVAILSDGAASLYLPEDRQLIRGDDAWNSTPLLLLLSGQGRLADVFEAESSPAADPRGQSGYRLRLVPRERHQGFEEVTVTLAPPEFSISEAEVLDDAGNRMLYQFRSLKRNQGISDERFILEPPPGTEVIGPS
jgi:outer membrane lipoprotein carrier protein